MSPDVLVNNSAVAAAGKLVCSDVLHPAIVNNGQHGASFNVDKAG